MAHPAAAKVAACLAALTIGALSATARADVLIATTTQPTPIRSWGGVAAFSLYDAASGTFRMAISRDAGAPELLGVAPQSKPFDLDVGPDSSGSPTIVYSHCEAPAGCDLFRFSPDTGTGARIASASAPDASETSPSVWGAQIAWARVYDKDRARTPHIYTRMLTAPAPRPSRRLAEIPKSVCPPRECGIDELELRGRRLAMLVAGPGPVCDNGHVRLQPLSGRAIRVADITCGLNGQSFVGVSFDARNLYFAAFRAEVPAGGGRAGFGAVRYALATGRFSVARFGRRLTGFSFAGDGRAYEVLAPDTPPSYDFCGNSDETPPPNCLIVRTDRLSFTPGKSPH
jgi:hypothetical protein